MASFTACSPFLKASESSTSIPASYAAIASSQRLAPCNAAPLRTYPLDHPGFRRTVCHTNTHRQYSHHSHKPNRPDAKPTSSASANASTHSRFPARAALRFDHKTWFVGSSLIACVNISMAVSYSLAWNALLPLFFNSVAYIYTRVSHPHKARLQSRLYTAYSRLT